MPQDTYSFVVRIWREAADSRGNVLAWRGSVDSVSNGERLYFDDLAEISIFIGRQIGLSGAETVLEQTPEIE